MSPGRPNAPPRPHPTHSRPRTPKKASLSRVTRSPPCPIQPHARPTSSPRLRHFSPPIRPNPASSPAPLKHAHIRATLAHARDRPRGPETLPPKGVRPQASEGASKTGHRPPATHHRRAPCPPLSRGVTPVSQKPVPGVTDLRRTGGAHSYETHRMSQKLTDLLSPAFMGTQRGEAPGNLKQPHTLRTRYGRGTQGL